MEIEHLVSALDSSLLRLLFFGQIGYLCLFYNEFIPRVSALMSVL